jgi:hypothetical protein
MSSGSESISRVWDACHRISPQTSYARSMDEEPLVSVVRGTPTDLELAALVTLLAARSTAMNATPPPPPARSYWATSARPSMPAPGWRKSALPIK